MIVKSQNIKEEAYVKSGRCQSIHNANELANTTHLLHFNTFLTIQGVIYFVK